MIAIVSAGAVGVAVAFAGLVALLTRHNRVAHRAAMVQNSDPRTAQELRDLQATIDRGTSARIFF